jgi:lysozyme
MRATGIDVSAWNNVTDWQAVKTDPQNLTFVFIKSSEGMGYKANYKPQWDGAGSIGLLRSCYHYHHGEVNGAAQADYFMAWATKGELPPVIDFEDADTLRTSEISGAAMFENLRVCAKRIESVWKIKPILYSGFWFIWQCMQESPEYDARWMAEYPLWIAHYTGNPDVDPSRPSWWPWKFYQYTSSGAVKGIAGRVDLNVYNGTLEELRAWVGILPPEELTDKQKLDILWAEHENK